MLTWFTFSILSAFGFSVLNALSKRAGRELSGLTVAFWSSFVAAVLLMVISFVHGFPEVDKSFWVPAVTTALINVAALPLLIKAYQWGELSSVFPMLLLTPVFMLGTSYAILGERATGQGIAGMLMTLVGLFLVAHVSTNKSGLPREDNRKGMLLGLLVSFLYSISANFDKLTVLNSDRFFGPAMVLGLMSLGLLILFLVMQRSDVSAIGSRPRLLIFPNLIGLVLVFDMIVFYTALSFGLASHTVLVKRTSIMFGVLWGWIFFKERNIAPKLVGILIAIAGLAIMLIQ